MRKIILTLVLILGVITCSNAQDYKTAVGLRGGLSNGITIKHFVGESTALEGIFYIRWRGYNITGLYEKHKQAFGVERLNWYYGFGGHLGFWNGAYVNWANNNNDYTVIGVDGILGIEYNFEEIPINLSLDWKPALNIIGYFGFWGDGGALSIRYIF
ncbi:MAG: hypothetical protein HOD63_12595 [Bacteroidetes bacterium]|jgi:hypothetical protein|nr:hypothetical protein [Bacteroidota bacterium]MBT5529579.1 hypothetical protein [Cytophagia bacterium]MBT3421435.1 hypothetical protein [Bacteroidota bacterium]MBT3802274.1 hypothetical protein [Bacteroidota bacterium]MBT3932777.1 hypothetical protein [Bacteroidota bacterium]